MIINFLRNLTFRLDLAGVVGFFHGDVAIEAMATIHTHEYRQWLGWYNTPGGFDVARRYGQLCASRFWDSLYPGVHVEPAVLLRLDGQQGPRYRALYSGTVLEKTSHAAHLLLECCKALRTPPPIDGRQTKPVPVTVVDLKSVPDFDGPLLVKPLPSDDRSFRLAAVPILTTLISAAACAVFGDWLCCAIILAGAMSTGLFCLVIGSATLTYSRPTPARGVPLGDGILDNGSSVVVLLGDEGAVNAVTKGSFHLLFKTAPEYHDIGICCTFLTFQSFIQLLVIPQCTLLGQIMFLGSMCASWVYNSFLCSLDREDV